MAMKKIGSDAFWKASSGFTGLFALLAILIAANVIIGNTRLRADLTEEKLYTLSEGTRSVLRKLDRDVTLKMFFNSSAPEVPVFLKNYARQVEDLLREYKTAVKRRVVIEKYDPKPDSDAEDWARRYGIGGQQIGMLGPTVYFGLVAVAGDTEAVIPALDPRTEELLEYNITRLIYRVVHPEKPVVGIISSLPVMGTRHPPFAMPGQPRPPAQPAWFAFQDLKEDYSIREIPPSADEIDTDIDALIVVHPKNLEESLLYAIDQFVLRGGRLLAFLDPLSVADAESSPPQPYGGPRTSSNMERLLSAWGIGYDPGQVLVDPGAASQVRDANNQVEESFVWLSLRAGNMSHEDILTTQLEGLMLPYAGTFSDETGSDLTVTSLVKSSENAGTVASFAAQFGSQAVQDQFAPAKVPLDIAIRVAGTFTTAFPEGKPRNDTEDDDSKSEADSWESARTGNTEGESAVILVADVDMIVDRFCVQEINFFGFKAHQPINDNISFLANAVEQVAGSSDLIGIRSRGRFSRPFDRVLDLEEKARREWQAKENDLLKRLRQTQRQLSEMESRKDKTQRFILSKQQKQAIARFRREEVRIKKELKSVRKNLRRDIERLGIMVKIANIGLMPLLVSVAGVCFGIYRKRKR